MTFEPARVIEVERLQRFGAGERAAHADLAFIAVSFSGGEFALEACDQELLMGPRFGSSLVGESGSRQAPRFKSGGLCSSDIHCASESCGHGAAGTIPRSSEGVRRCQFPSLKPRCSRTTSGRTQHNPAPVESWVYCPRDRLPVICKDLNYPVINVDPKA